MVLEGLGRDGVMVLEGTNILIKFKLFSKNNIINKILLINEKNDKSYFFKNNLK